MIKPVLVALLATASLAQLVTAQNPHLTFFWRPWTGLEHAVLGGYRMGQAEELAPEFIELDSILCERLHDNTDPEANLEVAKEILDRLRSPASMDREKRPEEEAVYSALQSFTQLEMIHEKCDPRSYEIMAENTEATRKTYGKSACYRTARVVSRYRMRHAYFCASNFKLDESVEWHMKAKQLEAEVILPENILVYRGSDLSRKETRDALGLTSQFMELNRALHERAGQNGDAEQDFKAAERMLAEIETRPYSFRDALELFVPLKEASERCDLYSYKILAKNYEVLRPSLRLERVDRLTSLLNIYRLKHAKKCRPKYRAMYNERIKSVDKAKLEKVKRAFSELTYVGIQKSFLEDNETLASIPDVSLGGNKLPKETVADIARQVVANAKNSPPPKEEPIDLTPYLKLKSAEPSTEQTKPNRGLGKIARRIFPGAKNPPPSPSENSKRPKQQSQKDPEWDLDSASDAFLFEPCRHYRAQLNEVLSPARFDAVIDDIWNVHQDGWADEYLEGDFEFTDAIAYNRLCGRLLEAQSYMLDTLRRFW